MSISFVSLQWRLTYLLTYAHRSRWSIGHQRPPAIALCSGLLLSFRTSWSPAVSALLQCLASNCCEAGLSSSSLVGVPGQGLGCGAGCWLPEGVSDPAPLPPQYLLGHWFLSRSLPQIFISDLSLAIGFCRCASGVEECLDLSLHHLCCPPCHTYNGVCMNQKRKEGFLSCPRNVRLRSERS